MRETDDVAPHAGNILTIFLACFTRNAFNKNILFEVYKGNETSLCFLSRELFALFTSFSRLQQFLYTIFQQKKKSKHKEIQWRMYIFLLFFIVIYSKDQ